ncbi:MAG: S1C family serine protease [Bacteroidales bacterium]
MLVLLTCIQGNIYAQRRVSEEAKVFNATKESVFTVFGDRGHGSGFLIDERGLVLTNYHVVAESKYLRVKIDESTKVAAKILSSDPQKDIAVLVIHPDVVMGIPPLNLAVKSDSMVFVGEKVISIGSPLNQIKILTSGIVSKVEPHAIISDVNINPGNSGGPLINMDKDIIGINTFGDISNRGPGVSGSLLITEAENVIITARNLVSSINYPSSENLPVMPEDIFPLEGLKAAASIDSFNEKPYIINNYVSIERFNVRISTPPYDYYRTKRLEMRLADKRHAREINAGNFGQNAYDPFRDLKEWAAYTGEYKPVVTFEVQPKIGQTSESLWGNFGRALFSGYTGVYYRGNYTYEFKGDLADFFLKKNGTIENDIQRSRTIQPMVFYSTSWDGNYSAEDMAQVGTFTYPVAIFAPDNGKFPEIQLIIHDLLKPDVPIVIDLPEETIKKVWVDFAPYTGDYSYVSEKTVNTYSQEMQEKELGIVLLIVISMGVLILTL